MTETTKTSPLCRTVGHVSSGPCPNCGPCRYCGTFLNHAPDDEPFMHTEPEAND